MDQAKHEDNLHPKTCEDQSLCELFGNGQCDGTYPCPKNHSPR